MPVLDCGEQSPGTLQAFRVCVFLGIIAHSDAEPWKMRWTKCFTRKRGTGEKKKTEKNVLWIILCSAIFVTSLFTYFESWSNPTQGSLKFTVWLSMACSSCLHF